MEACCLLPDTFLALSGHHTLGYEDVCMSPILYYINHQVRPFDRYLRKPEHRLLHAISRGDGFI
jgi:hypothetical protein